jgi:4-hydroxy-3-polyprenylbenzoate decarboxylase
MAYYQDLREYLDALEAAGKLRRVSTRINKDTELHPLVRWQFRGLDEDQRTGWLFENLTGFKREVFPSRVATSILGANREVYALGLRCEPSEIGERWTQAFRNPIKPQIVETGPVKEVIHRGDALLEHGGLDEFAIPMATNGWECLPRLTAVAWHSRDPETGWINVGTYNGLQLGPLRANCRVGVNRDLMVHWRKAKQRGEPLQVSAVVAPVPAVLMASVAHVPHGLSELDVAGGLAGEPIPVVRCETSDLLVPASAEIVLEGEIPTDYLEPDGASGEHTGYTILSRSVFAFHITCITHRREPIWQDFISQMPPSESSTIRGIASEGAMLALLQQHVGIPYVKDVAFHDCAGAYRICVIRLQELAGVRASNEIVWLALTAALSKSPDWPKIVIAVDDDIDPHDLESVFWAVSFRYQPHRDTHILQGRSAALDQSAGPPTTSYTDRRYPTSLTGPQGASALLMDATRKWPYTPVSLPTQPYMDHARELWHQLGLPPLKPRVPWYGVNLGVWPEDDQQLAELAEQGRFDEVAEHLMARGERT